MLGLGAIDAAYLALEVAAGNMCSCNQWHCMDSTLHTRAYLGTCSCKPWGLPKVEYMATMGKPATLLAASWEEVPEIRRRALRMLAVSGLQ